MRKVYVEVKVLMTINAEEGVSIGDVIDECDYEFKSQTTGADIVDTSIEDYNVHDSK